MYQDTLVNFISLRSLFRKNNIPLSIFVKEDCVESNIKNVINVVGSVTGLDIRKYLFETLFLDALVLNEDRHYMNLGVCTKGANYGVSQVFDNGSSLFCTNWTYRSRKSLEENIKCAMRVARPFSKFFDKQVSACINLGAKPLLIRKDNLDSLISNYRNNYYSDELNMRIKSVLIHQLNYYSNKGVYIYV